VTLAIDERIQEVLRRDPETIRLRKIIDQLPKGFLDGETITKPCPLRGFTQGEDRVLLLVIKNRVRESAGGIVLGVQDWANDAPSAGILCQVSGDYSVKADGETPVYSVLAHYREQYGTNPFIGPAVFFNPNCARTLEAPEGKDGELWAWVDWKYVQFVYDPAIFDSVVND
jgi:hypothetical protein